MSERRSIGILGATGHVGKVLAAGLSADHEMTLYARRPEVASAFAKARGIRVAVASLNSLGEARHDALVNCIGVGDPVAVRANPALVYEVTCWADGLALGYLDANPGCRLVNFSSGAAYCSEFEVPAHDGMAVSLEAAALRPDQHYGLAKLASEGRHRALRDAAIIDLRLFSLFSRDVDSSAGFLMNEVLRCVLRGTTLVTGPVDHIRDYVAPADLCSLVGACIECAPVNEAVDVYSAAPVGKFEMLDAFRDLFNLAYTVDDVQAASGATGSKPAYFSGSRGAGALGYVPTRTSLETLIEESEALLKTTR